MRPFEKDSQSVVTKGRRKTKLAAPKTKSASAALIKRSKNRNIRNKKENDDDANNNSNSNSNNNQNQNQNKNIINNNNNNTSNEHQQTSKEPCQFVPVRRKPLGEYMKLESSTPSMASPSSPSPSMQGMRMSYAAAVETGSGVKVMISPRLNNKTKSSSGGNGKQSKANKIIADTKFRIFDEQQPKPHIVRVDPKVFRCDVEQQQQRTKLKNSKLKNNSGNCKAQMQKSKSEPNDVDIKALKLQFKRMACNAASNATVAIKGNTLSASSSGQTTTTAMQEQQQEQEEDPPSLRLPPLPLPPPPPPPPSSPSFADSVSYLSFHHERLQRIIAQQSICAICVQTPEPMKVPQFEDNHFKYLEEAALLAQNRTMLRLWMNFDQLIC